MSTSPPDEFVPATPDSSPPPHPVQSKLFRYFTPEISASFTKKMGVAPVPFQPVNFFEFVSVAPEQNASDT
jgi:hypothetical protein